MRSFGRLTMVVLLFCSIATFAEKKDANIDVKIDTSVPDTKLTQMVKPKYPASARQKGLQGEVLLKLSVDERGVPAVEVVSGDPALASAAVDAASSWRYKPYKKDGKKARFVNKVTFTFTLPSA